MGRYRIPDNAVFRRGSGRGIARLDYPKSDEWDPAKINQAVNMVSNINNAATGILGAKPLDLIVSGIARAAKDDDPIETGVRRAATARMRAQRDTGQQAQEQPAPQPAAQPAAPQAQEGMDLTSLGSFGAARRYARSGIPGGGLRTFRWRGKLYSTIGYQDEKQPRSKKSGLETEADWSADLKRSRDPRFYSDAQAAPVPTAQPSAPTAQPSAPSQKVDPLAVASLFEQYNVNPEDGIERLKEVISLTKENVSTPQETRAQVGYPDIFPPKPVDQELVDSVTKDQAMLEAYTQQQAAQPQQEVVQEEFTEESVDPDVAAARRRQQDRMREMREGRATPQREVRRRQMTDALDMLRRGSIPLPAQLPSNVEDIASIAMVVTDRQALPNLVRAARDSAMPTSFADLFTGNHERRAAKKVMDSFNKGEGKRVSSLDMSKLMQNEAKLMQNEEKLRIAQKRLENQSRNVTSQIERRRIQNNLSRVNARIKNIELNKILRRGLNKNPSRVNRTLEELLEKETGDSVAMVSSALEAGTITNEAAKMRLSKLASIFKSNSFRKKLRRNKIEPSAIRAFYSTLTDPSVKMSAIASGTPTKTAFEQANKDITALNQASKIYGHKFIVPDSNKPGGYLKANPLSGTEVEKRTKEIAADMKIVNNEKSGSEAINSAKARISENRAALTVSNSVSLAVQKYNAALANKKAAESKQ